MSPCKRAHTGHRLIKNASQRENVACRFSTLAEDLFRGHVARCAHHPARLGGPTQSARAPSRLQLGLDTSQTKIYNFHPVISCQKNVLGFEIAMDDAAGVGGIQSGSGLHRNASGVAPGQTAVAEPAPQGLASKQLGHHEGNTTLLAHIEKRHAEDSSTIVRAAVSRAVSERNAPACPCAASSA